MNLLCTIDFFHNTLFWQRIIEEAEKAHKEFCFGESVIFRTNSRMHYVKVGYHRTPIPIYLEVARENMMMRYKSSCCYSWLFLCCLHGMLYHCVWEDNNGYDNLSLMNSCHRQDTFGKNMKKAVILSLCIPFVPCLTVSAVHEYRAVGPGQGLWQTYGLKYPFWFALLSLS